MGSISSQEASSYNGAVLASDEEDVDKKRILVLNSYSDGYTWTRNVTEGIIDRINAESEPLIVRVEYMDTKYMVEEDYFEQLYELYKYKFRNYKFDAIISSDDNALRFLLRYRDELFKDIPVFFCGINLLEQHRIENQQNLYGVVEESSVVETIEVAMKQNPNMDTIYVVNETSVSGNATKKHIVQQLKRYEDRLKIVFIEDRTINEIEDYLKSLSDPKGIILFTFYALDIDGVVHNISYVTKLITEASTMPVYSLWSFSFGYGVVGGKMVTGQKQGERAVELMLDHFSGKRYEGNQHIESTKANAHMYDYEVMNRMGLDMKILPEESLIINLPVSFYQRHKTVILISLLIIVALSIYIIILRIQVRSRTREINKVNEELMKAEKMVSLGEIVMGVSHEMNTPLGTSLTMASHVEQLNQTLQEKYKSNQLNKALFKETTESIGQSCKLLLASINNASGMVEAFKSIAIQHEDIVGGSFDLRSVIENSVLKVKSTYDCSNLIFEVECSEGLIVEGRVKYYLQMIEHLLINSIEHGFNSGAEGKIVLKAHSDGEKLKIIYRDNGIGLKGELEEKIFEPFYTDKRGGNRGHLGLGLYMVYNVVQAMNGEIGCHSEVGKGVEFDIVIPINN